MLNIVKKYLLTILLIPFATLADNTNNNATSFMVLVSGNIGYFESDKKTNFHGVEYRNKAVLKWNIIPAVGYMWGNQHSQYIYADLKYDWAFRPNWFLTPSLGAGIFHNTDELDLGHPIEFRTGIEISREFKLGYRIGLSVYHLSNSKISNKNPGTEILVFTLVMPLKLKK